MAKSKKSAGDGATSGNAAQTGPSLPAVARVGRTRPASGAPAPAAPNPAHSGAALLAWQKQQAEQSLYWGNFSGDAAAVECLCVQFAHEVRGCVEQLVNAQDKIEEASARMIGRRIQELAECVTTAAAGRLSIREAARAGGLGIDDLLREIEEEAARGAA